jgi:hypothetical protein
MKYGGGGGRGVWAGHIPDILKPARKDNRESGNDPRWAQIIMESIVRPLDLIPCNENGL